MSSLVISRSFGTHDGTFHADEVTACALLLFVDLIDINKLYRSREVNVLSKCEYVCDVGGVFNEEEKRFDHHQASFQGNLSSAGMILEFLNKSGNISDKVFELLNNALIKGIDAHDLGVQVDIPGVCTLSHIIAAYNNIQDTHDDSIQFKLFLEAVIFALQHIKKIVLRSKYVQEFESYVKEQMDRDLMYLVFDKHIPWLESFFVLGGEKHKAVFVVSPSRNQWKAQAIPISLSFRMSSRLLFPKNWAGLSGGQLEDESGISGAVFCHKGRFVSIWKNKQSAIDAVHFVIRQ